ncbi:MAG: hypothetical protein AABX93_00755 [Nanoarchaeota archaeon]
MNKNMKIFGVIPLFIFLVGTISAIQICDIYDDFSSGVLDESKWNEIGNLDEHFIENKSMDLRYHTAQLSEADKEIRLNFSKIFLPGEIIEYDVNYVSGSGNRIHQITLNGNDYSLFGFWNSVSDGGVGNDFGTYHVKLTFTENGIADEITLPNGSVTQTIPDGNLPSPSLQHTNVGIITRTGHNGIVHMDYDNFVICSEQTTPPTSDLEQRISELENKTIAFELQVNELENKIDGLESRTSMLESSLSKLKKSFDDFVKKFENFIKKLPKGIRKYWN